MTAARARGRCRTAARCALVLGLALASGGDVARGHGASRGLHLHLDPDPAARGASVAVELSAAEPMVHVRLAFVGHPPVEETVEPPARTIELKLQVPDNVEGETVSCHAEVRTKGSRELRASAVLRLRPPAAPPESGAGADDTPR